MRSNTRGSRTGLPLNLVGRGRSSLLLLALSTPLPAQSPPPATVREYTERFTTYPYSDPDPIPVVGRIYPYFRFDGFAARGEPRRWKVVELENAWLRLTILPEIGGKIWNAVEKRTGRSFIYHNRVVKFRDIALRGPWTSGGIEPNYGIMGHTPAVAGPVDYLTRTNPDGSVSCIIGALDLLTRSHWRLEIRLPPDEAAFQTTSFWYNASPLEEPYYSWMNAAVPVSGGLRFVYPGTRWLGHEGEHGPWPLDSAGRDLSWYDRNDFGGYKSYHVIGSDAGFFGAFWHDHDFGMVRTSPRDEKPGRKLWIWGLSREGMIWERLLTDQDGQYAEVQSGRIFNQTGYQSSLTPFKHRGFAPHTADRWTETWYPVVGTKGFVAASRIGALNVTPLDDRVIVTLQPVVSLAETLTVEARGRRVHTRFVSREPLELFTDTVALGGAHPESLVVRVGGDLLEYHGDPGQSLSRPLDSPPGFEWQSAWGYYLRGKELIRQREYAAARSYLDSALALSPHFVPALADQALLALRRLEYDRARELARTALSVDTYDQSANYYYGLANRRLGQSADAADGFQIAALDPGLRGAAWTELGRMALALGQLSRAAQYADKALGAEGGNLDALGIAIVAARRRKDAARHDLLLTRLEATDPLSHQARLERLLAAGDDSLPAKLLRGIRAELPEQVLMELAAWYQEAGDDATAALALEAAGSHAETLYWRAWLMEKGGKAAESAALLRQAAAASPRLVFPFRPEIVPALRWATGQAPDWQPKYYLALALWAAGRVSEAESLFVAVGEEPSFAPFYAARAAIPGRLTSDRQRDLERAATLDPAEWRYGRLLAELLVNTGRPAEGAGVARRYRARFPENYIVGLTLARALLAARAYHEADRLLARLEVLPYEGASDGRGYYREAKLMLAVEAMGKRRWSEATRLIAEARLWPERLGAGKPYPEYTDERLEDWLLADLLARRGRKAEARALWERLAADERRNGSASDVLPAWALERLGRAETPAAASEAGVDGRVLRAWGEGGGVR